MNFTALAFFMLGLRVHFQEGSASTSTLNFR